MITARASLSAKPLGREALQRVDLGGPADNPAGKRAAVAAVEEQHHLPGGTVAEAPLQEIGGDRR